MAKVHDQPSDISAEKGQVHVDGPGGIVVALTPQAAAETAHRLTTKAEEASNQDTFEEPEDLLPPDLDDLGNFA